MGVGETIMVPEEWLIELQVINYIDYLSERIFRKTYGAGHVTSTDQSRKLFL